LELPESLLARLSDKRLLCLNHRTSAFGLFGIPRREGNGSESQPLVFFRILQPHCTDNRRFTIKGIDTVGDIETSGKSRAVDTYLVEQSMSSRVDHQCGCAIGHIQMNIEVLAHIA
jgi:hypothetical protein